jgi:hypothetical protein
MVMNFRMKSESLTNAEFVDKIEKAYLAESKIRLLINPKEEDHVKLTILIRSFIEKLSMKNESKELIDLEKSIVALSQEIFKREWIRVKDGE